LKDEKNNDQWHRTFTNIARAQDLSDVLHDLFWEKQKFLHAALEIKIENARGKTIIHKYENTYDAQKSYGELE
jgi:hypothetical protein